MGVRHILAPLLALAFASSAEAAALNGAAQKTGKLLTCRKMEQNCLTFAHRAEMAAGPDGVAAYNVSAPACYNAYNTAVETGVWPANPPFAFALACVKD